MSDGASQGGAVPQRGKAKRHTIPNERQCWVLQYKMGKGAWQIDSVHLTYDSVEEREEKLHEKFENYDTDIRTRHGSRGSPTELVGGEHLVRE